MLSARRPKMQELQLVVTSKWKNIFTTEKQAVMRLHAYLSEMGKKKKKEWASYMQERVPARASMNSSLGKAVITCKV